MTLLTICQDVARITPVAIPTTIVGSNDETASLLLACAQAEGKSLARRHNWLSLVAEHTFSTVIGQEDYDLPADFGRLENQTLWDRDNYERIRGPLSAQDWQAYKSSVLANTVTTWKQFRIRSVSGTVKFSVFPTPDAVETLVFEYASDGWAVSPLGIRQCCWEADGDTSVLDEYLLYLGTRWRFLSRLGMSYEDERIEYEREVSQAIARDGGAPVLSLNRNRNPRFISSANVPDTGYGA